MFTARDYRILSEIVFRDDYAGYKPDTIEAPNGDGNLDQGKRYAHIGYKYIKGNYPTLTMYLGRAHQMALDVSMELGIPKKYWPSLEHSVIRVLEYPAKAVSHPHTDFDLFTLNIYRNDNLNFEYSEEDETTEFVPGGSRFFTGQGEDGYLQGHCGEILELVNPKAYKAAEHYVVADMFDRDQFSMVYFAIPDHEVILPGGQTVGAFLEERISRSRY